ncbi:MAG: MBG domain-containing protein, partial [Clostridia bacterium]|nr:MBG domain-containing protein [Clostridia bacterium]
IQMGTEESYYVKAVLKAGVLNYTLDNPNNSHRFTLGKYRDAITITVSGSGQTFDGTPKYATFTTDSTLPQTDFELTYIDSAGAQSSDAPIHAGDYKVMITLVSSRTDNYYIANGDPVDFVIEKAPIDLSDLSWNYDDNHPFLYHRKDGTVASYTGELIGFEDGNAIHDYVKSLLKYSGTTTESSVSGRNPYTASFTFEGLVEGDYDFTDTLLPASLQQSIDWRIEKRVITKPAYADGSITFSAEKVDLLQLFGIVSDDDAYDWYDWREYFTITARYNDSPITDSNYDYTAYDIGIYTVVCNFLPGINDDRDNVSWDDGDTFFATATVTIDPRVINVSGWSNERIPNPIVGEQEDMDFIDRVYTDTDGNVVSRTDINNTFNTSFRVTLSSKYG